jgi:hypothetical protein
MLIGTNINIWMRMGLIGCEAAYKSGQLDPYKNNSSWLKELNMK